MNHDNKFAQSLNSFCISQYSLKEKAEGLEKKYTQLQKQMLNLTLMRQEISFLPREWPTNAHPLLFWLCWLFGLRTFQSSLPRFGCLKEPLLLFGDDWWPSWTIFGDLFWCCISDANSYCFLLWSPFASELGLAVFEHSAPSGDDSFSLKI